MPTKAEDVGKALRAFATLLFSSPKPAKNKSAGRARRLVNVSVTLVTLKLS
jgi:hypothetical protein